MIEPVRKSIVVEATRERAFRVFTEDYGAWWLPANHSIGAKPAETAVIEPRAGGRWFERAEDGTISLWGHVHVWDPPNRLVLLWQVGADWTYDETFSTEVEIRFIMLGPARTRIELEHRQLDRFGDNAEKQRTSMDRGWDTLLGIYATHVKQA